ncbi:MAG: excinuclease ABC subunit UvrA [Bacteroidales bacterium]|nr:excinuclease ABC subunit UvrA [Bacteroidales bacterium]
MPETGNLKDPYIELRGVRVHNLKNITVRIPLGRLTVITGLSGSGKSSLAFDTLYAEGQRRYVESLSAYARQFLGRMQKPDVDFIEGIPPAIAIEQKVNSANPRSTVGTSTEVYDYLKLLYARIGKTISPASGREVKKDTAQDVADFLLRESRVSRSAIIAPVSCHDPDKFSDQLRFFLKEGFSRIFLKEKTVSIEDMLEKKEPPDSLETIPLLIDRLIARDDPDTISRITDSAETAFQISDGRCKVFIFKEGKTMERDFSNRFEADGILFEEPSTAMFSFNSPVGACPVCEGYGKIIGIDEDLVIPDKSLSVYEDAIVCWRGEKMRKWKEALIYHAPKFDFPVHRPYYRLTEEQKKLIWTGNQYFGGLNRFFSYLEEKKYKIQYRVMLSRYRGKTVCPVCHGTRLKKEASWVRINEKSIPDLVDLPVEKLQDFFENLQLTDYEKHVAGRILTEITNRLRYMMDVGLGYLTLNRLSSTLSGGESQRINLATSLGSSLVGSLYILDEPSIGLHPRDTHRLIRVLEELRDMGNTVVVVEHDESFIRAADHIIDMGPLAGRLGGEVVFAGPVNRLLKAKNSITRKYLTGEEQIKVPAVRRPWNSYIEVTGASEHNLKNISIKFPLQIMTVVTGVSGSGKSTLVGDILYPALSRRILKTGKKPGNHLGIQGDLDRLNSVELVDQNPIGKSSRSNPVTYIKAYDDIRKLFAEQPAAKINHFSPSHFSFNVTGGRCEECQGEGVIHVEMQFMADVELICESCHGKRFKPEILEVTYQGKSIYDVLEMTVDEAIDFFGTDRSTLEKKIIEKLKTLSSVGLGYIHLGQPSNTLSGGESQRVKLASFLKKENRNTHTLFIFDEPTTGLHFHDIRKLLGAFDALIEHGNTIILVEHNPDVIKAADWIIDLGPEGGEKGGDLVFQGTPEALIRNKTSHTARYLREKL